MIRLLLTLTAPLPVGTRTTSLSEPVAEIVISSNEAVIVVAMTSVNVAKLLPVMSSTVTVLAARALAVTVSATVTLFAVKLPVIAALP